MSYDLAETYVFSKQSPEPLCCNSKQLTGQALHRPEHPFFRRYGANWSSSLRMVIPSALEFSSHPPVSVYGTDTGLLTRGFSWQYGIERSASPEGSTSLNASEYCSPDLPELPPARLARHPIDGYPILLRHPIARTETRWYRNLCACFPSPTLFSLGLGSD